MSPAARAQERAAAGPSPGLYFSHPACLEHDPAALMPEHPDVPERLEAIERKLQAGDWLGWERREAPAAADSAVGRSTVTRSSASRPIAPPCTRRAVHVR